jgi:hypothetical protein
MMPVHCSYSNSAVKPEDVATVTEEHVYPISVHSKALKPEQNEALRRIVRKIIDEDFEGKVSVASKKLGVSHSLIFEFLDGRRGLGMKALEGISNYTGRSIDELLGRRTTFAPSAPSEDSTPLYRNAQGWPDVLTQLRARRTPQWQIDKLGGAQRLTSNPVTLEQALSMLSVLMMELTPADIEAAIADVERQYKGAETRAARRLDEASKRDDEPPPKPKKPRGRGK